MLARAREFASGALFCALGVTLPILFHVLGVGRVFLPMHLPILFAGLVLSPAMAILVGFLTPWVSMLFTGMPPLPMAIIMCIELGALAGVAAVALRGGLPVWAAAMTAVAVRIGLTFVLTLSLAQLLHLPPAGVGLASVIAGMPGVVLQLLLIPAAAYPFIVRHRTDAA
jgi:hypothetical protein